MVEYLETSKQHQSLSHVSANIAKALSKPESYVMVDLEVYESLMFAGNQEPAAYLELKSIGLPSGSDESFITTFGRYFGPTTQHSCESHLY